MKEPLFKGSCTALITPFNESGIDYERLKKNIDYQYEGGTSAIVICGTNSSFTSTRSAIFSSGRGVSMLLPVKNSARTDPPPDSPPRYA